MYEYGIWDNEADGPNGAGGFIETQLWTKEHADRALASWKSERAAEGEDSEALSIAEICPDHEEQPKDGCEECEA